MRSKVKTLSNTMYKSDYMICLFNKYQHSFLKLNPKIVLIDESCDLQSPTVSKQDIKN